jgi:hypothetical protein
VDGLLPRHDLDRCDGDGRDTVWIKAENLPIWHPYFEYLVVGYVKRALDLLGAEQIFVRRVTGGPSAGLRYQYELRMGAKKR